MTLAIVGICLALFVGGIRAVELWRIGGRVEVINVAVVSAFGRGKAPELSELLRESGPAIYLRVASAIAEATQRYVVEQAAVTAQRDDASTDAKGNNSSARPAAAPSRPPFEQVEREARAALILATRRLHKHSWLDTLTVVALVYVGVQVAVYGGASTMLALGMLGATLLWLSNIWGARHMAQRFAIGAAVLIESLRRTTETVATTSDE